MLAGWRKRTSWGARKTVWQSGLRRWLKAPVRKGVGSNPTAVSQAGRQAGRQAVSQSVSRSVSQSDEFVPRASLSRGQAYRGRICCGRVCPRASLSRWRVCRGEFVRGRACCGRVCPRASLSRPSLSRSSLSRASLSRASLSQFVGSPEGMRKPRLDLGKQISNIPLRN